VPMNLFFGTIPWARSPTIILTVNESWAKGLAMQGTTDKYGARYGGGITAPFKRPQRDVDERTKTLRALFGFLSLVAAIGGGIYAYIEADTVWLGLFVAGGLLHIVGRAIPDVITDDKKMRRSLYFLLLPALATAGLYLAYQAWDKWWLAFVVGVVGGGLVNAILAPILFPGIHREESQDSAKRFEEAIG
jgi:hypothetical protein